MQSKNNKKKQQGSPLPKSTSAVDIARDGLSRLLMISNEQESLTMAEQLSQELSAKSQDEAVNYLIGLLGESPEALDFIHKFMAALNDGVNTGDGASANNNPANPAKNEVKPQQTQTTPNEESAFPTLGGGYRKGNSGDLTYIQAAKKAKPAQQPQAPQNAELAINEPMDPEEAAREAERALRKAQKKERQQAIKSGVAGAAALANLLDKQTKVGSAKGLNGRLFCECLAARHGLLTNCLTCGKIICKLEGPGPCPQCGTLVESAIQQVNMIMSKSPSTSPPPKVQSTTLQVKPQQQSNPQGSKSPKQTVTNRYGQKAGAQPVTAVLDKPGDSGNAAVFPTLMTEKEKAALARAEAQREKLLEYQRNSTARTRVHDTASDFDYISDANNKWLSAEERALALIKAKEQERMEEEAKRRRVISLDLGSKKVVAVDKKEVLALVQAEHEAEITKSSVLTNPSSMNDAGSGSGGLRQNDLHVDSASTGVYRNPSLHQVPQYIHAPVAKLAKEPEEESLLVTLRVRREAKKNAEEDAAAKIAAKQQSKVDQSAGSKDAKAAAKAGKSQKNKSKLPRLQDDYDVTKSLMHLVSSGNVGEKKTEEPPCG